MGHICTPEFEDIFECFPIDSQKKVKDPLVIVKLFDAHGSARLFLTEYNKSEKVAFGYWVGIAKDEWDYVKMYYIETMQEIYPGSHRIKRDLNFTKKPLSEALKIYREEQKIA